MAEHHRAVAGQIIDFAHRQGLIAHYPHPFQSFHLIRLGQRQSQCRRRHRHLSSAHLTLTPGNLGLAVLLTDGTTGTDLIARLHRNLVITGIDEQPFGGQLIPIPVAVVLDHEEAAETREDRGDHRFHHMGLAGQRGGVSLPLDLRDQGGGITAAAQFHHRRFFFFRSLFSGQAQTAEVVLVEHDPLLRGIEGVINDSVSAGHGCHAPQGTVLGGDVAVGPGVSGVLADPAEAVHHDIAAEQYVGVVTVVVDGVAG